MLLEGLASNQSAFTADRNPPLWDTDRYDIGTPLTTKNIKGHLDNHTALRENHEELNIE